MAAYAHKDAVSSYSWSSDNSDGLGFLFELRRQVYSGAVAGAVTVTVT